MQPVHPVTRFDLRPHLLAMARQAAAQPTSTEDLYTLALRLNGGAGLVVRTPHDIPTRLPGVSFVPDPIDEDEDDETEADVSLVIYRADPVATAAEIEHRFEHGQRVALVDLRTPGHSDPLLMRALLASTVYVGSLAAFDTDIDRALLTVMTPLRDGKAFREMIAHSAVYWWAWQGIVRGEIERRFGMHIADDQRPRAIAHARTRLGAHLLLLHRRGLRYHIAGIDFPDGMVESFTFGLRPTP